MWQVKYLVRCLGVLASVLCLISCSTDINITTHPEVVWTDPDNGATNVSTASSIEVGFSRMMDASTITNKTFSLNNGVEGTVSCTGTIAEFHPSHTLAFSTTYTATITTGARDKDGNALESDHVWLFTTKPPPPTVSGFSPDSGVAGTVVTVTGSNFSSSAASNTVKFNGASATILEVTSTEIQTRVPFGSTTGPITVSTPGGNASSAREFRVIQPGRIWALVTSGTGSSLGSVIWQGTQFVAVGASGTVLTSHDGLAWTVRSSGITSRLNGIAWSGAQLVAVGDGGALVTSPDGRNWTVGSSGVTQSLFSVAWSGSRFFAVGADGTIIASQDGISWSPRTSRTLNWLYDVTVFGNLLAVCGHSGTILTSTGGVLWEIINSGTTEILLGITATQAQLTVVGYSGTILTSPEGQTWTSQESGTTNHLGGVTWGLTPAGVRLVVVGVGGAILTSSDAIDWLQRASPTTADLNDVAWSGVRFVAVGENGTILVSE